MQIIFSQNLNKNVLPLLKIPEKCGFLESWLCRKGAGRSIDSIFLGRRDESGVERCVLLISNKPRKWWLAGLLSLFEPGLGQIYNGQGLKGLIFLVLPLIFFPAFYFLCRGGEHLVWILGSAAVLVTVFYLAAVLDALFTARKYGNEFQPKKYNKLLCYIGIVLLVGFVNIQISSFIKNNYIQAYKIPAASNEPTLLIGDHILVDRHITAKNPNRGDLIVFEYPEDPNKDFVKRVVAVTGDTVEIRNKVLFVNGLAVLEPYVMHKDAAVFSANLGPRDNFKLVSVPENSYFVMGDNRDKSYDSRFWGFVEKHEIKGTVKDIYWSWDGVKDVVRWERIGKTFR